MTKKQAESKYKDYLKGHIGNVAIALEVLNSLDIPFVKENIDKLRDIVKDHDKSKYEDPEWSAYLHHFYPKNKEEEKMEEEFDSAVKHHIRNNKHHWNYWCDENNKLVKGIDKEDYKLHVIERICDWLAMAGQHNEGPSDYWELNKDFVVQPAYAKKMCEDIFSKVPKDFSKDMWKGNRGELDESILLEVKAQDITNDSKQSDPTRIERSKKVTSTYIGMSKFGILNFKTTSQTRNGYHYQTIEFKDLQPFWDIIEEGKEIVGADIKDQFEKQDINVFCSDESFTWWAWYHKAYKNDYAYIDDKIPDLNNRLKAPKVNNVSLRGGSCKHILSVLDYVKKPYVLMQIAQDMTDYLKGTVSVRDKQSIETTFQADAVKSWDREDIENYLGMSRNEIISELRKIIQTDNKINSVYDAIYLGLVDDKDLSKLDRERVAKKIESELDLEKELENLILEDPDGKLEDDVIKAMGESVKPKRSLKEAIYKTSLGGKYKYTIQVYLGAIKDKILPIVRSLGFSVSDYPYAQDITRATYRVMQEDVKDLLYFVFIADSQQQKEADKDIIEFVVKFEEKESEKFSLDLNDSKQIEVSLEKALDSINYNPYREEQEASEEEQKRLKAEQDKRRRWKEEEQEREEAQRDIIDNTEEVVIGKADFPDLNRPMKIKSGQLTDVVDIEDINTVEDFKRAFKRDFKELLNGADPIIAVDKETKEPIAIFDNNMYEINRETGKWEKNPVKW